MNWKIICDITYIAIGVLPLVYSVVVKKWPIKRNDIFFTILALYFGINLYPSPSLISLLGIINNAINVCAMSTYNKLPIYYPKSKYSLEKIATTIQDIVNSPPYYINYGIDLNAPRYFSWEPVYDPIKVSIQKITAIFVDYELSTNDPKISLRKKDNTQKDMKKNGCFLYVPKGCPAPLWLKYNNVFIIGTILASAIGLGGLLEIPLFSIDVKHLKVKKMLSSDPKAHKYSSIVFAGEEVISVEE